MDLLVAFFLATAILAHLVTSLRESARPGRMAKTLSAMAAAVWIHVAIRLLQILLHRHEMTFFPAARLLDVAGNFAGALGAVLGASIVHYIASGTWSRAFYFLAFLGLLPAYGATCASLLWLLPPALLHRSLGLTRDNEMRVKTMTIFCGVLAGGLVTALLAPRPWLGYAPMAVETLGPIVSLLFLFAGLQAARDPENEFSYASVTILVRNSLVGILLLSTLPILLLSAAHSVILIRFLIPSFILAAAVFIVILSFHFESPGIRTFLILMLIALAPVAVEHLYGSTFESISLLGLRLLSRTALVLASLFILKQYMRWGFEIAQVMVMIITALSTASIVFLVVYLLQPGMAMERFFEKSLLQHGILFLDVVVLFSLPPLLVNYRSGTMKVTWAILSFGLFLLVYADFIPLEAERFEIGIVGTLAHGLIALAFATLWRYSVAMIREISEIASSMEAV
jgi:hypothetical protein